MNKIIISILIILFIGICFFKDKILTLFIHIPVTPIENIDTSFFTNDKKQELINIGNILLQNNIKRIDFVNSITQYYDFNNNVITINTIGLQNIEQIFEKYNIKDFTLQKDDKGNPIRISVTFLDKKFIYTYFFKEHTYIEGDIIFYLYRIEKVIDKNWYIIRLCESRNICPNL